MIVLVDPSVREEDDEAGLSAAGACLEAISQYLA
jgi:hypothetical protein